MERGGMIAGRYELVERLGRGGMGEVWAGRDRELRREVALKLLFLDDDVHADLPLRFDREGVAAAQVNHPNVVALYDRGVQDDLLFLVMEKVDGPPLSQLLPSPGLPVSRALTIADGICAALAAAHRAGVVHYDIKPHNVMLAADGTVKVVDFGIAGFVRSAFSVAPSALLTPAGTPEYAAPEQFRTERGDERSDLYALGGVLYAMLAGEAPFSGHNAWAVIARKAEVDAPRLGSVRPGLPVGLTALVAELLERDPARRPRSAQEVRERLREVGAGLAPDPVAAAVPPVPPPGRVDRVERAVSIACRIPVPLQRAVALSDVAAAIAVDDADAAEHIVWRHVPARWQGVALLQVAGQMADPARVRRLVERAEPLLAQATGHPQGPWGHPEDIALLLARSAPARVVSRLGGIERLLQEEADVEVWRLVTVAELAGSAWALDRERVGRIVERLERRARTLPRHSGGGYEALTRIAVAVHPVDRACAERLLGLAEQSAADLVLPAGRDRALARIASLAAPASLGWAERIAGRIGDEGGRAAAWGRILAHAHVAEPEQLPRLTDAVERQLAPLRRRTGRLFRSRRPLSPGHGRDLVRGVAPAVAAFDPPRAEALASRLDPGDRAWTLVAMARRVSGDDPELARTWLGAAYRAAMDDTDAMLRVRDVRILGRVAAAAAAVDRQLARHSATHLARAADLERLPAYTLAELAEDVAAVDAPLARRLVTRACRGATGLAGLGAGDRSFVAQTLVSALLTVMGAEDENGPQDTADLIDDLSKVTRWADTTFLWGASATQLAARNPRLADRLITTYDGPDRDGLLACFVAGLTPDDPDRAVRLADSLTDDEVRNAALREIAVGSAATRARSRSA